jgi:CheY-like chemotaxis protein
MTRTILLADDSVTIQKVVELTFLDEDFRVVAFGDGAEAIARLQEVRPDVVIADVHMPGADGYQVAEAVRERLPGVPVLLLVGTFEVFDAARGESAGAAGHLKKPFDSQELMRRVNELAASPAAQPLSGWTAPVTPQPAAVAPPLEAPTEEPPPALYEPEAPVYEPEPVAFEPAAEPGAFAPEPEPGRAPTAVPEPSWTVATPAPAGAAAPVESARAELTDEDVERIARRVADLVADKIVREVAWEVVPDLAEVLLKARIRELEASVE